MANWEELPQVILELIVRRLAMEDFLAVRQVCTSWRTAAAKETYNAKSKTPWLMIYTYNQIAKFANPSTGRIYPVQLPGCPGRSLSPPAWILVSKRLSEYRLVNPFSHISIELPTLEKLHQFHHIHLIALSSSPSLSRSYSVMISYGLSPRFAFLRSGEDAWTVVNLAKPLHRCSVLQLIYYNGLFVALDAHLVGMHCYIDGDPYLIECSGSLLVAWKIWDEKYGGSVKEIRVFKVDLEKKNEEEFKSFGNVSLFFNGNSSFSVEFNAESCLPRIKPNRVYYPDYKDKSDEEL
ncbi:hypothetical protein BT93_E1726 [Corymbia citriodora subsp. variegata]|nr:hypothetical protein BT93_E1726 [Corymbia citriodora subsp. variegata]